MAVGPWRLPAGEGAGVLLDGEDVGVAGDAPHVGRLVAVDGRLAPHPGPDLVWIVGVPGAVEEVEALADRMAHVVPPGDAGDGVVPARVCRAAAPRRAAAASPACRSGDEGAWRRTQPRGGPS